MSTDARTIIPYPLEPWWRRPTADDRPPLYWHAASRAFAITIRIVPRPHRFELARRLALLSAPLIKRTSWYGRHEARGINTPGEVALHYALNIMSNAGVSFDLKMRVEGGHHVTEAVSKAQGVIIVCPHSLLTYVLIRYLHDIGQIPAVVSAAPLVPIYGTRTAVHALQPAADLFIRARTVLRRGGVICAMIDESPPDSVRTRQFTTLMGPMFVSDALIRLAKRCDAHLLFTCGRLDERQRLVLTFVTPAAGIAASEHDIAESFVDFIASH